MNLYFNVRALRHKGQDIEPVWSLLMPEMENEDYFTEAAIWLLRPVLTLKIKMKKNQQGFQEEKVKCIIWNTQHWVEDYLSSMSNQTHHSKKTEWPQIGHWHGLSHEMLATRGNRMSQSCHRSQHAEWKLQKNKMPRIPLNQIKTKKFREEAEMNSEKKTWSCKIHKSVCSSSACFAEWVLTSWAI